MAPPLRLEKIDPDANCARFYEVALMQTLFGEVSLLRRWGRIGTHGQSLHETHPDSATAETAAARLIARKLRRGYRP